MVFTLSAMVINYLEKLSFHVRNSKRIIIQIRSTKCVKSTVMEIMFPSFWSISF